MQKGLLLVWAPMALTELSPLALNLAYIPAILDETTLNQIIPSSIF